jgi:hypothetical protein
MRLFLTFTLLLCSTLLLAQTPKPLFADYEPVSFTLTTRMQSIYRDRIKPKEGEKDQPHPARMTFAQAGKDTLHVPVVLTVRGNFRRSASNCRYPPLYLNLPKKAMSNSVFAGQNKLKLVTPCQTDELVVREYMVYRLFNLLTDMSFRAKLAQVTYVDSVKKKVETHWGILLEDADDMAGRNHARLSKVKMKAQYTDSLTMATAAVFEYMIGNTDWSVPFQHNMRLLVDTARTRPFVVPYDFDHAGIVEAPYANPAEQLGIASVRERIYRGPTYLPAVLNRVFARYNELKPQFYALYQSEKRLSADYARNTIRYLDEFYQIINSPSLAQSAFGLTNAQAIQIRGLK